MAQLQPSRYQSNREPDMTVYMGYMGQDSDEQQDDAASGGSGSENSALVCPSRVSATSSRFWGGLGSEKTMPANGPSVLRQNAVRNRQSHPLGAVSQPFKQLSMRIRKWQKQVMPQCCTARSVKQGDYLESKEGVCLILPWVVDLMPTLIVRKVHRCYASYAYSCMHDARHKYIHPQSWYQRCPLTALLQAVLCQTTQQVPLSSH